MLRACAVLIGLLAALPALAGEMTAAEARRFVIGKMFSYNCFEGTRGQGRVHFAALPAGTLQVKGEAVCASLRGLPIHPCFNLERTGGESFRGSIAGLGFAYCNFTQRPGRAFVVHHVPRHPIHHASPLTLRPSLTAEAE